MASSAVEEAAGSKAALEGRVERAPPWSSKTRKIVPSAMPAASAICFVVVVAAVLADQRQRGLTIAARRSSGDIGGGAWSHAGQPM